MSSGDFASLVSMGIGTAVPIFPSDRHAGRLSSFQPKCEPNAFVLEDSDALPYEDLLIEPQNLVLQMNHGHTWLSIHREQLRERFSDSRKRTTVFLAHPDSMYVKILAFKGSTSIEVVQSKIRSTVQSLEALRTEAPLEILGHNLFNPHSAIVSESFAITIPYYSGRGARTVPAVFFTPGAPFFEELHRDMEILRVDAVTLRPTD